MKKLNIAFVWHFHQPNYQPNPDGHFLLPWVRLHATKDYLDMLLRMEKFKNLKLNFNFSPVLLNAIKKYINGAKDIHLNLLLKNIDELTKEDKIYILNNYFDLNYKNMVLTRDYYAKLYNKRINMTKFDVDCFSLQEYSDIMANYTLCWIDKFHIPYYPKLEKLFKKEKNYTQKDREQIYEIQLDIMKRILTEYKKFQDENKIEVSTSPYYHPIVPLLIDFKNKEIKNFENLPENFSKEKDIETQINLAFEKYQEIFKTQPKGMWLPEHCICSKTTQILSQMKMNWTISDEGILSKSLKKDFSRDFEGNLEDPFDLCLNYKTKTKNPINLLFANSFFSNLINFGYGNYDGKVAARDLYDKIKIIQAKLQNSPRKNHIITIALDGENCWETYQNDGAEFLDNLYSLISQDKTLETVLVNDFMQKVEPVVLNNLKSGSWINQNFDLWIGEETKNIAWLYLNLVYEDYLNFKEKNPDNPNLNRAYREILVAQGSDWYWWYGEPNESKNDTIFDFLFRSHLANVYKILNLEIPHYLSNPLEQNFRLPLKKPQGKISPSINCFRVDEKKEWEKAGCIFVEDGPTSNVAKLIKRIYFGCDNSNLYFRFELNQSFIKLKYENVQNQISLYFVNKHGENFAQIRHINKNEFISPIIKEHFTNEVCFNINQNNVSKLSFSKAINWGLWCQTSARESKINRQENIIELKINFEDIECLNKNLSFFVVESANGLIGEVYPKDILINLD